MTNFGRLMATALFALLAGCAQQGVPPQGTGSEHGAELAHTNPMPEQSRTEGLDALSPEVPTWRQGDTWRYSDGYQLLVSSVVGQDVTFQRVDVPNDFLVRRGLFKVKSKQGDTVREMVYRTRDPQDLFPLAVGKQVVFTEEYLRAGEMIRHNVSWTVEGQETISVPAGTFPCWVLVMRTRGVQSDWVGMERWWYNPDVKHYVRLEYRYGTEPAGARVLMPGYRAAN